MFDLRTCESIHAFARAVADDWRWQASYDKRSGAVTLAHYDYGIEVRHDLSVVSRPFRTDSRARDILFAMTGVRVDLVQRADWSGYPVKKSNLLGGGYFVELANGDRYRQGRYVMFDLYRVGDCYMPSTTGPWQHAVLDRAATAARRKRARNLLAAEAAYESAVNPDNAARRVEHMTSNSPAGKAVADYIQSGDGPPDGYLVQLVWSSDFNDDHGIYLRKTAPVYITETHSVLRKTK